MQRIDAHVHFNGDHADAVELLESLDIKCVNICVAHSTPEEWRRQAAMYRKLADAHPGRYEWITTFDLPRFDDPDYHEQVIAQLDEDFAAGAVACKAWKNIGMEVQRDGEFVHIDDPWFDPIFEHLAAHDRPLIMHIGEPLACWQPLDPTNPHYGYYSTNPEWHMHGRDDCPHHSVIMAAMDRMIAKHGKLRIVGAHLGSQEYDVDEVAKRFEQFPNFCVDTSARFRDLALQEPGTVRAFIERYDDRILWGCDQVFMRSQAEMDAEQRERTLAEFAARLALEATYFETSLNIGWASVQRSGLALPEPVLQRIYVDNAQRVYGIGAPGEA